MANTKDKIHELEGMVQAYNMVMDNLCSRELIPSARDYVKKQRDYCVNKINKLKIQTT